jgi:ABC-type hemin transport system substrate-binding protein
VRQKHLDQGPGPGRVAVLAAGGVPAPLICGGKGPGRDAIIRLAGAVLAEQTTNGPNPAATWSLVILAACRKPPSTIWDRM